MQIKDQVLYVSQKADLTQIWAQEFNFQHPNHPFQDYKVNYTGIFKIEQAGSYTFEQRYVTWYQIDNGEQIKSHRKTIDLEPGYHKLKAHQGLKNAIHVIIKIEIVDPANNQKTNLIGYQQTDKTRLDLCQWQCSDIKNDPNLFGCSNYGACIIPTGPDTDFCLEWGKCYRYDSSTSKWYSMSNQCQNQCGGVIDLSNRFKYKCDPTTCYNYDCQISLTQAKTDYMIDLTTGNGWVDLDLSNAIDFTTQTKCTAGSCFINQLAWLKNYDSSPKIKIETSIARFKYDVAVKCFLVKKSILDLVEFTVGIQVSTCSKDEILSDKYDVLYPAESVFRRHHCFSDTSVGSTQLWVWNGVEIPTGYIKQDNGEMKKCTIFPLIGGYHISKRKDSLDRFQSGEPITTSYPTLNGNYFAVKVDGRLLQNKQDINYYLIPVHKYDGTEYFLPGSDPKVFTASLHIGYEQSFFDSVVGTETKIAGTFPTQNTVVMELQNSGVSANCGSVIKYAMSQYHGDVVFKTSDSSSCEIKQPGDCQQIIKKDTSQTFSLGFKLQIHTRDMYDSSIKIKSLGNKVIEVVCGEEKAEVIKAHHQLPVMTPGGPDVFIPLSELFGTKFHSCFKNFELYSDKGLTTSADKMRLMFSNDLRYKQLQFRRESMKKSAFIKVWGTKKGPGYEGVSQVDIRVCGYETIVIKPQQATFQTDSWDKGFELSTAYIQEFASTTDPECSISKIDVRQKLDPTKQLDASTGSSILTLVSADYQSAKIKIDPTKTQLPKVEFNIAYITIGGSEGFKLVTVDIIQIQNNCMGGIISQTLNPEPLNRRFKLTDETNNLNRQLQERSLRVLGGQIEFIFEDFYLQNLTAGTDKYNTGCNDVNYNLKLEYYSGQKYDGSNLDEITPINSQFEFAKILDRSVRPEELGNNRIMGGKEPSTYMKKWVETLDSSKKYNMIVIDPNDKDIRNMTYLLTIEANIAYTGQLPPRFQGFVNKATFSYQIDLGLCLPTRFVDTTDKQVAFGNQTQFEYWISNGTQIIKSPFDKIIRIEPFCGDDYVLNQTIDYSYVHNKSESQVDTQTLTEFIRYEYKPQGNSFFVVQTNDLMLVRKNFFQIFVTVKNIHSPETQLAQAAFRFSIDTKLELFEQNLPPYFKVQPTKVIQASNVSSIIPVQLPEITDPNGDKFQVRIKEDNAKQFVSYDNRKNMLLFTSETMKLSQDILFTLMIEDSNERKKLSTEYEFKIECTYCQKVFDFFGSFEIQDKIDQEVVKGEQQKINQVTTEEIDEEPPTVSIRPVTNDGILMIQFSKKMVFPSTLKPLKRMLEEGGSNVIKNYINITIEPEDQSQADKLKFDYFLEEVDSRELKIQMVFENPGHVSMSSQSQPDKLQIDFTSAFKESIFGLHSKRPVDFSAFGRESKTSKRLPAQMEASQRNKAIIQSMNSAQNGLNSAVSLNFILSFALSFSMNFLWGMINALQMIVYMPLLNLIFPAHVNALLAILVSVATFDVVPKIDDINESVFNFNATVDPLTMNSQGYEQLGFETRNFTMNTGSLFLVIIVFILNILTLRLIKCIRRRTDSVWLIKFQRKISFDQELSQILIRFLLEGLVELLLSAIISFELFHKVGQIYKNFSDNLSFTISMIFLVLIAIMPLVIAAVTQKMIYTIQTINNLPLDSDKQLIAKHKKNRYYLNRYFGLLFDGLQQREADPWPMHYFLIYTIRRMLFVMITYFFDSLVSFQVMLLTFMSLLLLMYLWNKKPFESRLQNAIEIFNETTIMMVTYHLFFFTDWIPYAELKNRVGISFIGFTCLNIFVNFSVMVFTICKAGHRERRKKKYEQRLKQVNQQINLKLSRPYQKRYVMQAIKEKKTYEQVMEEAKEKRRLFFIYYVPGYLERPKPPEPPKPTSEELFQRHIERTRRLDQRLRDKAQELRQAKIDENILNIKRNLCKLAMEDFMKTTMKKNYK